MRERLVPWEAKLGRTQRINQVGKESRRNEDDSNHYPSSGSLGLVQVSSCTAPIGPLPIPRTGAGAT